MLGHPIATLRKRSKAIVRPSSLAAIAAVVLAILVVVVWIGRLDRGNENENLDLVLADLERQVIDSPQDVNARLSVGVAYLQRGMELPAIEQFQQALALVPDHQTALIGLGEAHMALGDLAAAEEPLRRVVELNADNEFRYSIEQLNGVHYDLGRIAMERRDYASAAYEFQEALRINRTDADAWRLLGNAQQQLGDLESAEDAYVRAVRLVPDYEDVYRDLAGLYDVLGLEGRQRYAEGMLELIDGSPSSAIKRLERAVALAPEMAEAHEGLGIAYESDGRSEEALESYRSALAIDSSLFLSEQAVQRLAAP
jgi:Flp pilus assembly protein TadD